MLVLTRKQGQGFLLGDDIEITLLEISGDKIRIAINAPRNVQILRKELAEAQESNREALLEGRLDTQDLSALKSVLSLHKTASTAMQVTAPATSEQEPPKK